MVYDWELEARNMARKHFWAKIKDYALLVIIGLGLGLEVTIILTGPVFP